MSVGSLVGATYSTICECMIERGTPYNSLRYESRWTENYLSLDTSNLHYRIYWCRLRGRDTVAFCLALSSVYGLFAFRRRWDRCYWRYL